MTKKPNPIKLIIADDHEILANGMASILAKKEEFEMLGTASNGKEVLEIMAKDPAHVIIMDLNMPILDGIETTQILKKEYPKVKVLIFSMFDREGYIQSALDIGVDGYVLKNIGVEEIVLAIHRLLEGKTYFSQEVMEKVAIKMRHEPEPGIKLSATERRMLKLLSEGDTSGEISEKMNLATNSVMSYRKLLLQKFEAKNVSHMVKMAYELGYLGEAE